MMQLLLRSFDPNFAYPFTDLLCVGRGLAMLLIRPNIYAQLKHLKLVVDK